MMNLFRDPAFALFVGLVAFGTGIVVQNLRHPHVEGTGVHRMTETDLAPAVLIPDRQPTLYGLPRRRFRIDGPGQPVRRPAPLLVATIPMKTGVNPSAYDF